MKILHNLDYGTKEQQDLFKKMYSYNLNLNLKEIVNKIPAKNLSRVVIETQR